MMQPQGLGALMPQGAQQAPQMNNPRLNAAVDVVSSDAEKQILDPRTLAMLKYKDALQAMQAADQMMAASQPQPMPPTVAERTKLAAEQGIAGLASRLSPGIQRQGGNMQAQQMQQAVSGGLPQLPAPNMARMAGGGIVAFQDGGRPEDKFLFTDEFGNPVYESDLARTMNAEAVDDTPEGRARRAQYEALQREGVNLRDLAQTPEVQQQVQSAAPQLRGAGTLNIEAEIDRLMRPAAQAQAAPQVAPQPRRVEPISEAEALSAIMPSPSAPVEAQPSTYTAGLEALLEQTQGQKFDPEAAAEARSAELRRLTGADDLIAQRAEAEAQRKALAETRFSPEAQRRRALRAGLAGLAERGLGGFSAGAGAEDERIYAEQAAEGERSVAEMDRLIADFRQMGMTEFEARNAARTSVQGQADTQTQRQADILSTLAEGEDAAAGRAVQREQIDAQLEAARINASNAGRLSQFDQVFSTLISKAMRDNPGINPDDAKVLALEEYYAREEAVARGRLGVQESGSEFEKVRALTEYMQRFESDIVRFAGMSEEEKANVVAAERARVAQLYGINQGTATPTGNSSTTGRFAVERIN
jgi:hypothetical protein